MIPKLKAKELVDKFSNVPLLDSYEAKQCALVAVVELIKETGKKYWYDVKNELEKL